MSETSTITVKLDVTILEKIECIGDNVVGIYIKQFQKKTDKPIEVGDKILSVSKAESDTNN